jgi:hypothetical protein
MQADPVRHERAFLPCARLRAAARGAASVGRFGLYGLVAGLLVGFLTQLVFLALGLVRRISGLIKRPVHQPP